MKKTFLLFSFLLLGNALLFAQSSDEKAVAATVEKLKTAIIDANEAELKKLTSPSLSYGHSNGLLEDQKEFIRALVSEESKFTKIDLTEQTISISGDVAVVRHKLFGDTHNKGKDPAQVKLGVLMIFQKAKGNWVLLARQAFKL
ncbi:nuclear transport factor 2 family protein [Dyadobacter sp. 676]|uniref:Nuclear transport factor 2 family protein n=1 Tax=Dyadobacter sp. 676 TaxID=3088362 RepID=A0AAU8FDL7_9BACT